MLFYITLSDRKFLWIFHCRCAARKILRSDDTVRREASPFREYADFMRRYAPLPSRTLPFPGILVG